ncbi:hypothetical protein HMPREF9195_00568 [Treponema medium ATCC 700293]|uniref:Uncharacterized protein n=1 Tax=Treponema medium ATCC 700293 TaxID=1125700 RepID=A0AA87NVZ4_TREMD|nr:hypothetical protein HMPREF9195_00568 [Treponema medium ATCC 700293]
MLDLYKIIHEAQEFIKEKYIQMYEKWCEYSHESFYIGK